MDGTVLNNRECNEYWRNYGAMFPFMALGGSSSYFVTLIVLLRLFTITKPLGYEAAHKKISRIACPIIWTLSLLLPLVVLIFSLPSVFDPGVFYIVMMGSMQILGAVPMVSTLIIYGILLYTLKKSKRVSLTATTSKRMKSLERMTHGIIAALVLLNGPGALFYMLTNKGGMTSIKSESGDYSDVDVQV